MPKMRWLILIASCLAAGGAAIVVFSPPAKGGPRVEVDRDAHNWGRVAPGSQLETAFVIRNSGGKPVLFGEPRASCGCTKPTLRTTRLEAGERTVLDVGFRLPGESGTVRHTIVISTNDPARPELQIALHAESWIGVRPMPQSVDVGRLAPGDVSEQTVQLFSPDGKPFRITHAASNLPEVSAVIENKRASLPLHRVRVSFRATDRLGQVRGSVQVMTDQEDASMVDVPLVGWTSGAISATPSSLQIESSEIGEVVKRSLIVRSSKPGESIRLSKLDVSAPWEIVDHAARPTAGGLVVEISLRFPKGAGSSGGALSMALDHPASTSYNIP